MIVSFGDKETEKVYNSIFSRKLPHTIQFRAHKLLTKLNLTSKLTDLQTPPSNHLESLTGDRIGQWSIRINRQWRITFTPINGGSDYADVKIEDYH